MRYHHGKFFIIMQVFKVSVDNFSTLKNNLLLFRSIENHYSPSYFVMSKNLSRLTKILLFDVNEPKSTKFEGPLQPSVTQRRCYIPENLCPVYSGLYQKLKMKFYSKETPTV